MSPPFTDKTLPPWERCLMSYFIPYVCFSRSQTKIDPCDSREDPVVCAALIDANAYIDMDDVFEAEKEFWKVMLISLEKMVEEEFHPKQDNNAVGNGFA